MSYSQPHNKPDTQNNNLKSFADIMAELKSKINLVFHNRANIDQMATKRGLPPFVLREIMSVNPLSICIKKE